MKIISCAGFGGTGSSIITDLFRECSNVYSVGGNGLEFFFLHEPDGIKDLENALVEGHRFKVDFAIKRFKKLAENLYYNNPSGSSYKNFFNGKFLDITNDYLNSLGIIEWKEGWWHRIFENKDKKFHRFIKNMRFQKYVEKYYSLYEPDSWKPVYTGYATQYYCNINKNDFIGKTKVYLEKLFSEINTTAEYLLFDQLFPPTDTEEYIKYFDHAKAIVVERDPRDLYFVNKVYWGCGFMPFSKVETFIVWYKKTRNIVKASKNVLTVKFEDFLYKTEDTIKSVLSFIGLSEQQHDKKRTFLFPEKSITNTQLIKRIRLRNNYFQMEIIKDISLIETQLKDYLYNFNELPQSETINQKEQKFIYSQIYNMTNKEPFIISFFVTIPKLFKHILRKVRGQ